MPNQFRLSIKTYSFKVILGKKKRTSKLVLEIWNQAKEEADSNDMALKSRTVDLEFVVLKNKNGPSNQSVRLEFDKPLSILREKPIEDPLSRKDWK